MISNIIDSFGTAPWQINNESWVSEAIWNVLQVLFILLVCRYIYGALIKKGDARYVGNEAIYSLCIVLPLFLAASYQTFAYLITSVIFNTIIILVYKRGNIQNSKLEAQGVTSFYPKEATRQREAYENMSEMERALFQQQLEEKARRWHWKYEIKPLPATLFIWIPSCSLHITLLLLFGSSTQ